MTSAAVNRSTAARAPFFFFCHSFRCCWTIESSNSGRKQLPILTMILTCQSNPSPLHKSRFLAYCPDCLIQSTSTSSPVHHHPSLLTAFTPLTLPVTARWSNQCFVNNSSYVSLSMRHTHYQTPPPPPPPPPEISLQFIRNHQLNARSNFKCGAVNYTIFSPLPAACSLYL